MTGQESIDFGKFKVDPDAQFDDGLPTIFDTDEELQKLYKAFDADPYNMAMLFNRALEMSLAKKEDKLSSAAMLTNEKLMGEFTSQQLAMVFVKIFGSLKRIETEIVDAAMSESGTNLTNLGNIFLNKFLDIFFTQLDQELVLVVAPNEAVLSDKVSKHVLFNRVSKLRDLIYRELGLVMEKNEPNLVCCQNCGTFFNIERMPVINCPGCGSQSVFRKAIPSA